MAEWLTLDELSGYLKCGRSTLYKMAREGRIPATKIGRDWRFDREGIDAWLRQQSSLLVKAAQKKHVPKGKRKSR